MRIEFEIVLSKKYELDLLQFIPEKFRDSPILVQLVEELSLLVGNWLQEIEELNLILDPYQVREEYLKHLATLINVKLVDVDARSEVETRRELTNAVDWYKLKGSYRSLDIVAGIIGKTIDIYDLYTNDYITFVSEDWFVGGEDENPPDLDSTYYKSPHFGFHAILDTIYEAEESDGYDYLWSADQSEDIFDYVENIRPAHTVPNRAIQLDATLDGTLLLSSSYLDSGQEGGVVQINLDTGVAKWLMREPTTNILYFDSRTDEGGFDLYFDDVTETWYFDQGVGVEQFDIDTWKVGTGNKCYTVYERQAIGEAAINTEGWDLENVVASGDTTEMTITKNYVVGNTSGTLYVVKIPKTVEAAVITEFALYEGTIITYILLFPGMYHSPSVPAEIHYFVTTSG